MKKYEYSKLRQALIKKVLMETVDPADLAALSRAKPGRDRVKMYRKLASKYHPDTHHLGTSISNEEATSDFQEIGNLNDRLVKREEQPQPQQQQSTGSKNGQKANSSADDAEIHAQFNEHYKTRPPRLPHLMWAKNVNELMNEYGRFCYSVHGASYGYWVYRNAKNIMNNVFEGRYSGINYDIIDNCGVEKDFIRSKFKVMVGAYGAFTAADKLSFVHFFRQGIKNIRTDKHMTKFRREHLNLFEDLEDTIKDTTMSYREKYVFYRDVVAKHITNLDTGYDIKGKFKHMFLK